jgi:hypothetical protein
LSRTPSIETTARLLPGVRDRHVELDVSVNGHHALAENLSVTAHGNFGGADLRALVLDAEADRLRLPDNSETRCLCEHDAAVDFVLVAGNQRMQRGRKTERGCVCRHVVYAAVSDQDDTGDAVRRDIGERGGKGRKQFGPVGFSVRRAGFRHTHFEAGNPFKPLDEGGTRGFGLLRAVAEALARTLVDDNRGDRGDRLTVFARERGIGECQHQQRQRQRAQRCAAAARKQQNNRN